MEEKRKLPAIQDLYSDIELAGKQNDLIVLLNQPPRKEWLKPHPTATKKVNGKYVPIDYIPIERVEFLLTRIFIKWRVEVKAVQLIANSVVTTIRLHYQDPISGDWEWQDGLGASPLQTDKDAGATDFDKIKSAAVMIAAPASESYAVKDAAEKIGKLFGKDINRADQISYDSLNVKVEIPDEDDLKELFELKKEALTEDEIVNIERIITRKEKTSYKKVQEYLKTK